MYATALGAIAFFSTAYLVYKAWNRYKFNDLDRLGSTLAYGLITGVPVFVFTLLCVFI